MSPSLFLLFIFLELPPGVVAAGTPVAETKDFVSQQGKFPNWLERAKVLKRYARGTQSRSFGGEDEQGAAAGDHPRAAGDHPRAAGDHPRAAGDHPRAAGDHPRAAGDHRSPQSTARSGGDAPAQPGNSTSERWSGLFNPLYPLTDGSYWAYAFMLLAFLLFTAGVVGNLALMCTVWHNIYLRSTWNCVLAGLALWDFLVLFFCLPVVVFHELSVKRLLGDLSCRLVPYLEVTSLGVATFSLCALSIDRFNAAVAPRPSPQPRLERCQATISKLSIIWVGSMLLAAPELLLWKLLQETLSLPALPAYMQQQQLGGTLIATLRTRPERIKVDVCVREPSVELSDSISSLVLTYHEARMWWFFGCYVCLPLLFSLACDLLTRHLWAQRPPEKEPSGAQASRGSPASSAGCSPRREHRLRSSVLALALLHMACSTPESICSIVLSSVSAHVRAELLPPALSALGLLGQLLLFLRCAATPWLMLFLCRPLGQAFVDGCCCGCCGQEDDCSPSFSTSTTVTSTSASPTSLSPSSKDGLKTVVAREPAACRGHFSRSSVGVGTPC